MHTLKLQTMLISWVIAAAWAGWASAQTPVRAQEQHAPQQSGLGQQGNPTMEAVNVLFRYSPELAIQIVRLRGTLIPVEGHTVASFNDAASFEIGVEAAEIRVSSNQLTQLMNARVTRSPKAQVKDLRISVSGGQMLIDGTMKKGLHVPFHAVAGVGLTNDNRVRIDVHQVHVVGVPVKGLLDALGLSMEDLISQKGLKGMSVDGDSFLIDPQTALPAPHIRARVAGVEVTGDGIVLRLGDGAPEMRTGEKGNYIAIRGGRIEYGRDEMFDSNLTMVDSTPRDPFEFYLNDYWKQMVAASIKVTPDQGLRIRVPDYSKIGRSPGATEAAGEGAKREKLSGKGKA